MPWTVTNSFKRGLMKTYSRPIKRILDEEPGSGVKRLCVQSVEEPGDGETNLEIAIRESSVTVPSSPSHRSRTLFSSDAHDSDSRTPPSSPPPRVTPPAPRTRKPAFQFLKRKHARTSSTGEPLSEVDTNSVRASEPPKKKQCFTQMQIDLGGETRKTCAICGMEYISSNSEDVALHKRFHDMNVGGIDLGKAFVKGNASRWVYEATRVEGYMVIVDRKSSPVAKNQAKRVLEVVNKELSAAEISDELLWSQISLPTRDESLPGKDDEDHRAEGRENVDHDHYKVFMLMKESKCVGVCLAERISQARRVQKQALKEEGGPNGTISKSSSLSVGDELYPAIVGISRIWTSSSLRRKGIAMDLLDCVVTNYIYGMEIDKDQVAFSQPTESGGHLAESFFGQSSGWPVYTEA